MKVINQLGVGGFRVVDLVEDGNGKRFARKTFSLNQTLSPVMTQNVKKRFIREAKVQQGFSRKNIVPVVGGNLDGDPPFYLMPVALGASARLRHRRRSTLLLDLALQLARAGRQLVAFAFKSPRGVIPT